MPVENRVSAKHEQKQAKLIACLMLYLQTESVAKLSMEDLAQQAGISRATLYRLFPDKQQLLEAALVVALKQAQEQVGVRLRGIISVSNFVVEAMLESVAAFSENPLLKQLFVAPGYWYQGLFYGANHNGDELRQFIDTVYGERLKDAQEDGFVRDDVTLRQLQAWLSRCFVSFLIWPDEYSGGQFQMRDLLESMLLPAVLD